MDEVLRDAAVLPGEEVPALAELYPAYVQRVAGWVRRLGGPGIDVEDAVHDVFLVVHAKLPSFRPEAKLSTWLYRICLNVVRYQRRKNRVRRWLMGTAAEAAGEMEAPELPPTEALEGEQRRRQLYRILDRMKQRDRTVLILFDLEGLPGTEVAELLDAKLATVYVWLHRARLDFNRRVLSATAEERA